MTPTANAGRYHIGLVAKSTGLSTHTIRVWERRYGAVTPERSPGGTREYTDAHIDKLLALRALTESGVSIGRIAGLDMEELRAMLESARRRGMIVDSESTREAAAVAAAMRAIMKLDVAGAERILHDVSTLVSPLGMVFDVIAPLVQMVGDKWQAGDIRIAHEHAATAVVRSMLGTFLSRQASNQNAPVALAATVSGELHELGAMMAAFVAMTCGWRVLYLGPNLPAAEIRHAASETGARLLLLSVVNQRTEVAESMLRELLSEVPEKFEIVVGGRSAPSYPHLIGPERRVADLRELRDRLESEVERVRVVDNEQQSRGS